MKAETIEQMEARFERNKSPRSTASYIREEADRARAKDLEFSTAS